jgi:hypothetical protein
LYFLEENPK